jgi:ribonuclease P protein component
VEKLAPGDCIQGGKHVGRRRFPVHADSSAAVEKLLAESLSILRAPLAEGPRFLLTSLREAHLSAQRSPAQAQARLSGANVDTGRAGHPEAAQGSRTQAPLRVSSPPSDVQRRNRLSRSRDFDAVYRHGRSVSTRFLVLYRFDRGDDDGEARLGIAVPKKIGGAVIRNRIKRRLREVWRELLPEVPDGSDYVLLVRTPLAEAESRDATWLRERVQEVLGKAQA